MRDVSRHKSMDVLQAYVRIVTGRSAEEWAGRQKTLAETPVVKAVPCTQGLGFPLPVSQAAAEKVEVVKPWGVEVAGGPTRDKAIARYREVQSKYAAILTGLEPHLVIKGIIGEMGAVHARVGADTARRVTSCAPSCVPPGGTATCFATERMRPGNRLGIAIETFWSFREPRPCPCLEECCRLRRLERIGTAAGNQIVADDHSPQADFPYWGAVLCEHQPAPDSARAWQRK